jgi:hypothetical protein
MWAYFGHHKAASKWATLVLGELAASLGLRTLTVYSAADWDGYPTLGGLVTDRSPDLLIVSNAWQVDADSLGPLRGFHVVRDPRDMIVSGYFSHRYSHPDVFPELPPHRAELAALDIDAGLSREIEFSGQFIDAMSTWNYAQPHILEIRMDGLARPVTRSSWPRSSSAIPSGAWRAAAIVVILISAIITGAVLPATGAITSTPSTSRRYDGAMEIWWSASGTSGKAMNPIASPHSEDSA